MYINRVSGISDRLINSGPTGEDVFERDKCISAGGGTLANQALRLSYFTAGRTEPITQVRSIAAVAAAATPTLCRIGIYSEAANGNLTLIHHTANDTTLWSSTNLYTKDLNTTFNKITGFRYAVGALCVTAFTAPTMAGALMSNGALQSLAPRCAASVGGQTDLPSSISAGNLSQTGPHVWFNLI